MARDYSGTTIPFSSESEFSVGKLNNMMNQWAAGKRADADLVMKQAQHDYQMKTYKKLENSTNALNEWAGKGLDYNTLTSNPRASFMTPMPSLMENFQGYKDAMTGYGLTASEETFSAAAQASQQRYMTQIAAQFNAVSSQMQAQPGVSQGNVYRVLKQNYGADQIYANMVRAGFTPQQVAAMLEYDPGKVKQNWLPMIGHKLWEPPIEGVGGGVKAKLPVAGYGAYAAGKGAWDFFAGRKELLAQAEKDWTSTGKNAASKFKTKYGMNKTQAGGSPGKNKVFESSKELKKLARSKGYGNIKVAGLKTGKKLLPYAAGVWAGAKGGEKITEMLGGGEMAQAVGGALGGVSGAAGTRLTMTKVAKKLADPAVMKRILPVLKKIAPKLAAKIGLSVTGLVVPEGVSSVLGAAGLMWSAYDLVQLANQAPEIYAALSGD